MIVIDVDQGQSGASAADRAGFQRLVADVSLGKAGIVLGLECSRLARNNADWHRLLELCSLSGTLICDEDGLYDPGSINDRLLLGLKGTISEAELHFIRARLQGGLLAKAARGELRMRLPVGLAYDQLENVTLDPDASVRAAIEYLFQAFERTGSAHAVVKQFAAEQLRSPPVDTRPEDRTAGRPTGSRCATTWCCSPCTTPGMRARTSTDDASSSPTSTVTLAPCSNHRTSGPC